MTLRERRTKRRPAPVCPLHGWIMYVGFVRGRVRTCYCPEDGCRQSAKQTRGPDGHWRTAATQPW